MESALKYLFVGGLREDYCITPHQRVISGALGGNAVYSAVGASIWTKNVGILSRVGNNFPLKWLKELDESGIDTSWVNVLDTPERSITFYAYLSPEERVDTNPLGHFASINEPMPKELIGYEDSTSGQDSRDEYYPLTIRPSDLDGLTQPPFGVHLSPAEYLTHSTLPYALRKSGVEIITLDPSVRYMNPDFRFDLPKLMKGIDAFLPSEMEAKSYFAPRSPGIWEMAEQFGSMGCGYVILKLGAKGQAVLDTASGQKWQVPAYPASIRDVTGAGDAFCGGFLIGLATTGDPLEAALMGSVSASLVVEGTGALFSLGRTPGLARSRLEALRSGTKRI
jgi:ribokinase